MCSPSSKQAIAQPDQHKPVLFWVQVQTMTHHPHVVHSEGGTCTGHKANKYSRVSRGQV